VFGQGRRGARRFAEGRDTQQAREGGVVGRTPRQRLHDPGVGLGVGQLNQAHARRVRQRVVRLAEHLDQGVRVLSVAEVA